MWCASASAPAHGASRGRRGVSLLEAVAALAIVGATSAGILAMTGAGVRTAERAQRAHEAAALADETVARIALLESRALRRLPDSLVAGRFAEPFDEYAWQADVLADAQSAGLFTVTVTVQWDGGVHDVTTALYRRPERDAAMSASEER